MIEISFSRVIEGRQHKMEVWQSREQEREAKEREERFLSGYPSYFNFSLFPTLTFLAQFLHQNYFSIVGAGEGGKRTRGEVSISHTSNL